MILWAVNKMLHEVSSCENCKIKVVNNKYVGWECRLKHELIYIKLFPSGKLNFECLRPTKKVECPDYKKGMAYTSDEMREKLGLKDGK